MSDNRFARGIKTRREVLGDAHVDRAEADKTDFDSDFQQLITEYAWGTAWQGEELAQSTRHLVTIAILAALGRERELALHVRATANTGITAAQLKALFMQVAIYAGVPAANSAFSVAKQILGEQEE